MKKVLIIAYYFGRKEDIGSIRIRGMAKYLPDYGWQPVVLTPKYSMDSLEKDYFNFQVVETDYDDIVAIWKKALRLRVDKDVKEQLGLPDYKNKKTLIDVLLKLWEEVVAYPDAHKGWYKYAVEAARRLLRSEVFDAVISSSHPPITHIIANKLKMEFQRPWIADFRDLWIQNHYFKHSFIRKFFEKRLEFKTLSTADALTTVSEPLAEKLKSRYWDKDVYVITNGFDPVQLNNSNNKNFFPRKFNITYTGTLYQGKRDPEPLFRAIQELIFEKRVNELDLSIEFYGDKVNWLAEDAAKYGLQNVVKIYGIVQRDVAIEKQRQAQILLLLNWNDPEEKGVYTGKLFDYLAAQRPILSIGISGGVVEELLKQTKAGVHVSNISEIKDVILKAYQEFKSTGSVLYHGISSEINKYTHCEMAKKFATILDNRC